MKRRDFLGGSLAAALPGGWAAVPRILERIRPPQFPDRTFEVTRYGAGGDGSSDALPAIRKALEACRAAGGGRVLIPPGEFLSRGPVHLPGNVELHLAEGAVLRFGVNPADYLPAMPVRWEGTRCLNYSPLIYACRRENVAVTGRGTIDGQARQFWHEWKRRQAPDQDTLRAMGVRRSPVEQRVFGEGHYLRPALFCAYECRNVLLEGVTLANSPWWTVHPVFSTNVTVRGVRIRPGTTNDDGVDPDSSTDVLIEDCEFETEDDHIAIKSGRDQDAWDGPACENVIVRRCRGVRSKANGFAIGSEMSGNVRNVYIEDNTLGEVQSALYVKANSDRGGVVENVWMRNDRVDSCDWLIKLETDYKGVTGHPYPPLFSGLHFENVRCRTARTCAVYSVGIAARPIEGVYLRDIEVEQAGSSASVAHTNGIEMTDVRVNGRKL